MRTFYSAESVTEGHPDKLCDLIADNVLDACLAGDLASRVACEVMATRGHIIVAGEITTEANPDVFNMTPRASKSTVIFIPRARTSPGPWKCPRTAPKMTRPSVPVTRAS
mgnify:CR=1 FL=1